MTDRPRILMLCSGAGGDAMGYWRAGFEPVGVDINPQPRYPFEFHQGDALTWPLDGYDAYHASPPCQRWATASRHNGREYPDLITPIRGRLAGQRAPWVIENVPRAPLRPDFKLCGCMFGLEVVGIGQLRRERWFETSWGAVGLRPRCRHHLPAISIAGHGTPSWQRARTGHIGVALWRQVMGIDWMTREELTEAIPPAYTEHVGGQLAAHLIMTRQAAV